MPVDQNEVIAAIDDFLEHHGVDGQQWGKRRGPPYPLSRADKAKNRAVAKREREKEKARKRMKKAAKKKAVEEKKTAKKEHRSAEEAAKAAAELAAKKAKYAKKPKSLYTHRELFTTQEIESALKGFEWENKMLDAMDKDFERAKKNVSTFKDFSKTIVDFVGIGIDGYNTIATLNRHFGGDMKPIAKLNANQPQRKDDDKK